MKIDNDDHYEDTDTNLMTRKEKTHMSHVTCKILGPAHSANLMHKGQFHSPKKKKKKKKQYRAC